MTATAGTDGTGAQGNDTPGVTNVSDGTPPVSSGAPVSSDNGNSASTPAATRSDDTRGAGYDLTKLLDNLDSLPERVANAVREAAAPATTNASATPATNSADAGSAASASGTAGSKTENATGPTRGDKLRGFWFGK